MKADSPRAVQLFSTCMIETLRPEAGMAVVRVLERLGITIEFPAGQTCCGQPAFNGGAWQDSRAMAKYTLDVLSQSPAPIVVPSGSCADMLVHHYPELLAGDPHYGPLAEQVAGRTYEFAQFLVDVLGVTEMPRAATNSQVQAPERIAYHPSCHLARGLKVVAEPRALLANAPHVEVTPITGETECCGFGGLFAIKMGEISSAMLERKLDALQAANVQALVGCDVSCLLHISGGLHRRGLNIETKHLAEILANE